MPLPEFHMTVGIPGVGKSTWSRNTGLKIHSSDNIRRKEGGTNKEVFDKMKKKSIEDIKNGISCIYDATNLARKRRIECLSNLKNIPCIKICDLFIEPIKVCKKRNSMRSEKEYVPEDAMERMFKSFQIPMLYEGFDTIILRQKYTDNTDYLKMMENFDQDNPHHVHTLKNHSLKTKEFIEKNYHGDDKALILEAALYHDIGKIFTKDFHDIHGNETKDAHYYGHDNYGAYTYISMMHPNLNQNKVMYVTNLINWHMAPYLGWKQSERSKTRDKNILGDDLFDKIMLLHKADKNAH